MLALSLARQHEDVLPADKEVRYWLCLCHYKMMQRTQAPQLATLARMHGTCKAHKRCVEDTPLKRASSGSMRQFCIQYLGRPLSMWAARPTLHSPLLPRVLSHSINMQDLESLPNAIGFYQVHCARSRPQGQSSLYNKQYKQVDIPLVNYPCTANKSSRLSTSQV